MNLRRYNLEMEGPEPIFDLFDRVYGDSLAIRQRWEWEWQQHPESDSIHIFVAEDKQKLIGMTVRMPIVLYRNGQEVPAWFATNSMVDPDYRGRGVIRQLYEMATKLGGINLSKGTAAEMYRQLLRMKYERVQPDTYQVCLLAPWQWMKQKIGLKPVKKALLCHSELKGFDDYKQVDSFHTGIDTLETPGLFTPLKSSAWLNWRYVQIPHRTYKIAVRKKNDQVISWCVLRLQGQTCYLVDMCWSDKHKDEPSNTIRYAKSFAKKSGAIKIIFWSPLKSLRDELKKQKFIARSETPYLSYLLPTKYNSSFHPFHVHLVYGDNDSEYLSG